MSTREPSFGNDLPAELKDKPASDQAVQDFYQRKAVTALEQQRVGYEAKLADATRPIAQTPAKQPEPARKPSAADWFQDPNSSVSKVAPTREEFASLTAQMQQTSITNAEIKTKSKFADWSKFEQESMKIINALDPAAKADPQNWEFVYYAVKGAQTDRIVQEEVGKIRTQMSAESTSAPNIPEPPKVALSADQKTIIAQLGLTEDKYRKSEGRVTEWAPRR